MNEILNKLVELYLWDIEIMSQTWMYYWFFPMLVFPIFFLLKWTLLTFPIWGPLSCICNALSRKK